MPMCPAFLVLVFSSIGVRIRVSRRAENLNTHIKHSQTKTSLLSFFTQLLLTNYTIISDCQSGPGDYRIVPIQLSEIILLTIFSICFYTHVRHLKTANRPLVIYMRHAITTTRYSACVESIGWNRSHKLPVGGFSANSVSAYLLTIQSTRSWPCTG